MSPNQNSPSVDTAILHNFAQVLNLIEKPLIYNTGSNRASQKEPFLIHLLRKELGKDMRQSVRKNLRQDDVVIYSDFSKGDFFL